MNHVGKRTAAVALVAALALLLLAIASGRSVISYASSGSMEPTIGTFDVFLVNPWPQQLQAGDIIVFQSLVRGEPAVHRIVGGDETGWYTQGDANPNVDQLAGEPPVTSDRVLGRVLTDSDGVPYLLPEAGRSVVEAKARLAVLETKAGGQNQLLGFALLGLALLAAFPAFLAKAPRPRAPAPMPRRVHRALRRTLPRGILGGHVALALLLLLVATGTWAATAATTTVPMDIVVVQDAGASDGFRAIAAGEVAQRQVALGSLGLLPTLAIVEPATAHVSVPERTAQLPPWTRGALDVEQTGRAESGLQRDALHVARYPILLPVPWLVALHDLHDGLPYVALAVLLAGVGWMWVTMAGFATMPVGQVLKLEERWL